MHQNQEQLPKIRVHLGMSDKVRMSITGQESSATKLNQCLFYINAISSQQYQNKENLEKISDKRFNVFLAQDHYEILQILCNLKDPVFMRNGKTHPNPPVHLVFSDFELATRYFQIFEQAGFQGITVGPSSYINEENLYIVRMSKEANDVFEALKIYFKRQGSLINYMSLEAFRQQILDKHKKIFENPDLSANELQKQLNKVFTLSISVEDKLRKMSSTIKKFKEHQGGLHIDLLHPDIKAFVDDLEALSKIKINMSLDVVSFKNQLTLESKSNMEEVIDVGINVPKYYVLEKTACEQFLDTHKKYLENIQTDDVLLNQLKNIYCDKNAPVEDKIRNMHQLINDYKIHKKLSGENLQSFSFTDFSYELDEFITKQSQSNAESYAPEYSENPSSIDTDKLDVDEFDVNAYNRIGEFGQRKSTKPTTYPLSDGRKFVTKRHIDEISKSDELALEKDNENDNENEAYRDAKKHKPNEENCKTTTYNPH